MLKIDVFQTKPEGNITTEENILPTVPSRSGSINTVAKQTRLFSHAMLIPEPTARSAVPGVSPGRGLLIPH